MKKRKQTSEEYTGPRCPKCRAPLPAGASRCTRCNTLLDPDTGQVRDKLPAWHANHDIIYPSRLAAEQCSSEATARYKQHLLRGTSCCDLTGGLGADAFYFAAAIPEVTYIERNPEYCEAARHNFAVLHADNIRVRQADVRDIAALLHAGT